MGGNWGMEFYLRNQTTFKISPKFFKKLWEILSKQEEGIGKFGELGLVLVEDQRMQDLNQRYRQKRRTTDVLTFVFDLQKDLAAQDVQPGKNRMVEIYISPKQALGQAKARGGTFYAELALLFIHGILHALGYTDENQQAYHQMWRRQNILFQYCLPVINHYQVP